MKTNILSIIAILIASISFVACSDSDNESNPYNDQVKRHFYPTTYTFRSVTNNGVTNTESWEFTYDSQNRISTYKCTQTAKGMGDDITSCKEGKLRFYNDHNGRKQIVNDISTTYSNNTTNGTVSYTETTTERATFSGNLISQIVTDGIRYENGSNTPKPVSSTQTFTYSDEFCTSSTYSDYEKDVKYSYTWKSNKLSKATIHSESKDKSEIKHETHEYSYNKANLACDYGFNTLAFIYGHMPDVYSAMNGFGKNTPYILEHETIKGYNESGTDHNDRPVIERDFQILDNGISNNVKYIVDSPTYSEYLYNFTAGSTEEN